MDSTRLGDRNPLLGGLWSRSLGFEAKEKRPSVPRIEALERLCKLGESPDQ